jgi:hypothetical protein
LNPRSDPYLPMHRYVGVEVGAPVGGLREGGQHRVAASAPGDHTEAALKCDKCDVCELGFCEM